MIPLILVHGTWARAAAWHLPGSPFRNECQRLGYVVYDFLWSGVLGGLGTLESHLIYGHGDPSLKTVGADDGRLLPWYDAGYGLADCVTDIIAAHMVEPCVVSHSHGLQVVAFSCHAGASYNVALSVSGPIRQDMQRARRYAMERIKTWTQFADPNVAEDSTILAGEFFGGGDATTILPEGTTIPTVGAGHSGLFTAPGFYGLFDRLPVAA